MMDVSSAGLVGRGIAAIGALLWILSTFLTTYSSGPESVDFWELTRSSDVVSLVLAVAVLLIVTASVFVTGDVAMSAVAVIAGFLLSLVLVFMLEAREVDIGVGAYLGALGATVMGVGAVATITPALAASARAGEQRLPFMDQAPPAPAGSPSAGWYEDPGGEARLRYWDGSRWSDNAKS
jgi:hypothetical protein